MLKNVIHCNCNSNSKITNYYRDGRKFTHNHLKPWIRLLVRGIKIYLQNNRKSLLLEYAVNIGKKILKVIEISIRPLENVILVLAKKKIIYIMVVDSLI